MLQCCVGAKIKDGVGTWVVVGLGLIAWIKVRIKAKASEHWFPNNKEKTPIKHSERKKMNTKIVQ